MKIKLRKHSCNEGSFANMIQSFMGEQVVDKCPFYWKMPGGGKTYTGNIYFFTFLGIRITISTIKKKDLWIT